jgi:hypothetical protein
VTLIKGLTKKLGSRHAFAIAGQKAWPRPPSSGKGAWAELPDDVPLKPHFSGFHFTKENAAASWCWERNFIAEAEGPTAESSECVVARKARLVRELTLDPEGWVKLALAAMHDVIAIPEEIGYPWDQVRAVLDAYNIVVEDFGFTEMMHPARDGKRSPREYAASHLRQLIARCEVDSEATVEMGFNAAGVLEVALGVARLLDLRKAGPESAANWRIARDVAAHVRKAATQFALQAEAFGVRKEGIRFPASLQTIFNEASVGSPSRLSPIAVAELLLKRQSQRLLSAWGLQPVTAGSKTDPVPAAE